MGAKTSLLIHATRDPQAVLRGCPTVDGQACERLLSILFPGQRFVLEAESDLTETYPSRDVVLVACFPGMSIVVASEFGIDRPSELPEHFVRQAGDGDVMLHAMHSVSDWTGFAVWKAGRLQRSLSISADNCIIESLGIALPAEAPFWSGERAMFESSEEQGDYPFNFHPLELGEEMLHAFLGFHIEGDASADVVDPEEITLLRYRRATRPWWKFWR
jgi:hypothetical protein